MECFTGHWFLLFLASMMASISSSGVGGDEAMPNPTGAADTFVTVELHFSHAATVAGVIGDALSFSISSLSC